MIKSRTIVGAMFGMLLASTAVANTLAERPFSRADAAALRTEAALAQLATTRPAARPPYMVRYPAKIETREPTVRPVARDVFLPDARWDFKDGGRLWTRAAMSAIASHGDGLEDIIPRDIDTWCPAYTENGDDERLAFWVGMMSALSKHESTYNPSAVGGGDLWYGLLQIYPDTAMRYGCRATTGDALKDPTENLSCAARIMAVTVARDEAVAVLDGRWRGVAADWGPMTNRSKISEMAAWTSQQSYCTPIDSVRPVARPAPSQAVTVSTMTVTNAPD